METYVIKHISNLLEHEGYCQLKSRKENTAVPKVCSSNNPEILIESLLLPKESRTLVHLRAIVASLQCARFFGNHQEKLSDSEWLYLAYHSEYKAFSEYEPIMEALSPSTHVFIIIQGRVAVINARKKIYSPAVIAKHLIAEISDMCVIGQSGTMHNTIR